MSVPRTSRRSRLRAAGLAVAFLTAGCGGRSTTVAHFEDGRSTTIVLFEESRVELHATVEQSANGATTVVAEFRPTEPNLHLYGQELPDGGIDGAGRPTRLVVQDPAWRAVGSASASVPSVLVTLPGFDVPFATYPDGPVTLRQPIEAIGNPAAGSKLEVTVTFMACSSAGLCFKPVEAERVELPLHPD